MQTSLCENKAELDSFLFWKYVMNIIWNQKTAAGLIFDIGEL